jgi:hypothetical protein
MMEKNLQNDGARGCKMMEQEVAKYNISDIIP